MVSLKEYCDEYCGGDYSVFPQFSQFRKEGHNRLFRLIQDYGGRNFVAARFGMLKGSVGHRSVHGLNWGPFDLEFGIALLEFVRKDQMKQEPPLKLPMICMPNRAKLLTDSPKGAYLDQKIVEYGGYENVARRLGLALLFDPIGS
jgi:hypothetical protein